jgi:cytochrome c-type biogenesis protein CcmF
VDPAWLSSHHIPTAPTWSLFVGQLGAGLILGGAILFLLSIVSMIRGGGLQKAGKFMFAAGCVCILGAMGSLLTLFLKDQFQFDYVYEHSLHNLVPQYKVAAVWSGQQGSFLLWASTAAIFGLLTVWRSGAYQRWYVTVYAVFLGSLCGILAYETPFGLIKELFVNGLHYVPADGQGLVPSLQNYWVVIHPPTIFTGFGSLTVPFAYAASAMLTGDVKGWLNQVRPWALVSISILGLGLVMGGLWAYETQGWGGFWAWDPVENVSFVPWLFGIAFVHGLIVQTTRKRWHGTNLLMGGLPFLLFVYGTFLTRSGFLSDFSVHSFAKMNGSALMILLTFMIAVTIAFVLLWTIRGRKLGKQSDAVQIDDGFNREKAYQFAVILVSGLAATIAIGMSIPFFIGLAGGKAKVVEEPLYHSVVVWFFIPIMILVGAAPFLSWRRMSAALFWSRVINILGLTIGILGIVMMVLKFSDWNEHSANLAPIDFPFHRVVPRFSWVMVLFGVTSFAAIANIWRLVELFRRSKLGVGGFLAHIGVATAMSGLIMSRGLEQKDTVRVAEGIPGTALGYTIAYKDMTSDPMTDRNTKVEFEIASLAGKAASFIARPGFFFFPGDDGEATPFTWPHIEHEWTHDVYIHLDNPQFTLWDKPITLKPGETRQEIGIAVTYVAPTRHGEPGKPGTSFGAKLKIQEGGQTYDAEPVLKIGEAPALQQVTPAFYAYIEKMDAGDKSIQLQMPYVHPLYQLEVFYKPMTMFVWGGTGMMFLGGMLAAFYRRNRRAPGADSVEPDEDAFVSIPQG